jgi:histidinol-phosphate aminotransferase
MYEVSSAINDVEIIKIPLNDSFQPDIRNAEKYFTDQKLKLMFICSPNNPTSNSMNFADVEFIIKEFSGIVVIDEAYIDFSDKPSFLKLVDRYPNLIVMQTFSKAFGLAAVRVGMAFTSREIIRYFNKMKPPYNISTVNQQSVAARLGKLEEYRKEVADIKEERNRISGILAGIRIIKKIYPSDANFLLVEVTDADMIYNSLVKKNIIVRNRNSVINNCLRITIGKKSENDKLIEALKAISV